jgi:hypothetical protein
MRPHGLKWRTLTLAPYIGRFGKIIPGLKALGARLGDMARDRAARPGLPFAAAEERLRPSRVDLVRIRMRYFKLAPRTQASSFPRGLFFAPAFTLMLRSVTHQAHAHHCPGKKLGPREHKASTGAHPQAPTPRSTCLAFLYRTSHRQPRRGVATNDPQYGSPLRVFLTLRSCQTAASWRQGRRTALE